MDDWMSRYATALAERMDSPPAASPLTPELSELILDLARVVAHTTERKNAPLAAYLAGAFASARSAQGADAAEAVREALSVVQDLV